jgi:iturin family lipopeptide synthetase B
MTDFGSSTNCLSAAECLGPDDTIWRRFAAQAVCNAYRIAVVDDECRLTYHELKTIASVLASRLTELGVGPGHTVGVIAERSRTGIAAILGIIASGAAYLPIDPEWPAARTRHALRAGGARYMVWTTTTPTADDFGIRSDGGSWTAFRIVQVDRRDVDSVDGSSSYEGSPPNLAYVLFTSGSTGEPKAVMIEHRAVLHLVDSLNHSVLARHSPGLHIAMVAPFVFDPSVQQIFLSLLLGHTLHIVPGSARRRAAELVALLIDREIDVCDGTPAHIKILACAPESFGDRLPLRHLLIGGDVLYYEDVARYFRRFPKSTTTITNLYGVAECTVDSTAYRVQRAGSTGAVPLGLPLGRTRVRILDAGLNVVPNGILGEICIGGDGVGCGYAHDPALTSAKFVEDPLALGHKLYRTGDLGLLRKDGMLEVRGRLDSQLKVRGIRIDPVEVEAHVRQAPPSAGKIYDTVVVKDSTERLVAYIVTGDDVDERKLRKFLRRRLPPYMIPDRFMSVEQLPLTANGKLDRVAVDQLAKAKSKPAPARPSVLNAQLAMLWRRALDIESGPLDQDADFFDSGGHSIAAALLLKEIEDQLDVSLSYRDLIRNPTLRSLDLRIKKRAPRAAHRPTNVQHGSMLPLSAQQRRIFLLHQLEPLSLSLNIGNVLYLPYSYKRERLQSALAVVVQRHENLRASFVFANGDFRRCLEDARPPQIFEYELPASDLVAAQQDLVRAFNVNCGPLMRVGVLKSDLGFYLLIDLHHLIADGFSLAVIERELLDLYALRSLSPVRLSFSDYAASQDSLLFSNRNNDVGLFWRTELHDWISKRSSGLGSPSHADGGASTIEFALDPIETKRVAIAARRLRASPLPFFGAVYCAAIFAVTGDTDIVFGTALSGRDRPEFRELVGPLTNVVPIRARIDANNTFPDLVAVMQRTVLRAHDNQHFEFERLAVEINRMGGPIYNVGLSILETPSLTENWYSREAIEARIDIPPIEPPHFLELNLEVFERTTSVRFRMIAQRRSLWCDRVPRLVAHFRSILSFVSDPKTEFEGSTIEHLTGDGKQRSLPGV